MGRALDAAQELAAITMVGDAIVAGLFAERHIALWDFAWAPDWYRRWARAQIERPWIVRAISVVMGALGLWWAYHLNRKYRRPQGVEGRAREWVAGAF